MSEVIDKQTEDVQLQKMGSRGFVYLITCIAAVGGFLFGFDTAIIAGAIGFITEHFHLQNSPNLIGFAVSSVLVGCMVGASVAGTLSDRFGRKKMLLTAALVFVGSAILCALPRTVMELAVARFLAGLAVGVESMLSPLYIAEIAPAKIRGKLINLNHVALTIGMLCAYTVGLAFAHLGPAVNWRWMFASGAVPSSIFLFALLSVPESPRWLIKQGLNDQALRILAKIGGGDHARAEVADISDTVAHEDSSIYQLFQPGLRVALAIGVVLAIFTQVTGINVILYYAPEVFKAAGFKIEAALAVSILVGFAILIANIILMFIIDKVGRKPLILMSTSGMGVFLGILGWSFYSHSLPQSAVAGCVLGYVFFFMLGLGPGFWTVISEIFPTRIRGRAMAIATFSVWAWTFLIAQTFPLLLKKLGPPKTFWLYGAMCVLNIIFVALVLPETKGKTLEQIEKMWTQRGK